MSDRGPGATGDMPVPGVGESADLGIRFLARLIDGILLGIVTSVILAPLVIRSMFDDFNTFGFGWGAAAFIYAILSVAITLGYFAFMESSRGQTVGKMLLGLRTEGPNGANPTLEEAFRRNAWILLGIIPGLLGSLAQLAVVIYIAVTINSSPTNTGWHDEFAGGTRVLKVK